MYFREYIWDIFFTDISEDKMTSDVNYKTDWIYREHSGLFTFLFFYEYFTSHRKCFVKCDDFNRCMNVNK